ncbi:DUF418 domain-containing protein [Glaciecola sp. 33A]|uniref:DUF418 domain-containing protein n=1 Tax=Glaciecola sp. 33A TaxID=2057807 RepID=UPI000C33E030|nr:hypothetical protein CXF81_02205 [Glaciecola sp. 33A]
MFSSLVTYAMSFFAVKSELRLTCFRYGPLEWIWRCCTFAQIQPLRKASGNKSSLRANAIANTISGSRFSP